MVKLDCLVSTDIISPSSYSDRISSVSIFGRTTIFPITYNFEYLMFLARTHKSRNRSEIKYRLYKQPRVQMLLSAFLTGKLNEIKPFFDSGGVQRFPIIETLLGASPSDIKSLLSRLTTERVLLKKPYQRVMCCPHCEDPSDVFVRHLCPSCKSNDLTVEKTIRHLACGNEVRISASKGVEKTLCEKCLTPIVGDGDYTFLGTSLFCNDCGAVNVEIIQTYFCSACSSEFSLSNATYLDVYSYRLNKRLIPEIQQHIILPLLMKVLSDTGFIVQTPGYFIGASGSTYNFSLIANRGETMVAFDIVQSERKIGVQSILPTLFKLAEQRSIQAFLIAIPELDKEAKESAEAGGIVCIEGTVSDILANGAKKVHDYMAELPRLNSRMRVRG
ncbi:MAG: hypothetical protein ACE5KU_06325 [Nitrososphaerales archaeon]